MAAGTERSQPASTGTHAQAQPALLWRDLPLPAAGESLRIAQLRGDAMALAVAEAAAVAGRSSLVLTPDPVAAERLSEQFEFFAAGGAPVRLLPDAEVLPYDRFSPHAELTAERLRILSQLAAGEPMTLIAAASTLLPRLPPPGYLRARAIQLYAGQALSPQSLQAQLEFAGYQRVSQVTTHGEYAVRGALIDFFPAGASEPVRVDFLDDEIESLRCFDADSQVSTRRISELRGLPAREIPLDPDAITGFRQRFRARFEGNPARFPVYREVSEQRLPPGIENYLPLFFDATATLWDYLPEDSLLLAIGDPGAALQAAWEQVEERHAQASEDPEHPPLNPEELFVPPAEQHRSIAGHPLLQLEPVEAPGSLPGTRPRNLPVGGPPPVTVARHAEQPAAALCQWLAGFAGRTLFVAESPGRREELLAFLRAQELAAEPVAGWQDFVDGAQRIATTVGPLDQGFVLPEAGLAVITESELFGARARIRRRGRRIRDPESLINDLSDLRPGAPVVHADHGVGRFVGLNTLQIDAEATEFLTLEYAGGDLLHVPVSSLQLISRYTGGAPEHAPLHRLGSDQWLRARRRAAEKVRDVAAELLDLYARRAARSGRPARLEPQDYAAFSAGFPFAPTEDQERAFDEVLADLTSSRPMDRLVCGDVGFGKTEVALRAAFVAVSSGHQVAVLVPTTLLAQQHYQTFADRFADWPVRVEQLSRFRSQKAARAVLDGLRDGRVDIVIGTHRLLQPGVEFADLGLVIVDEEHRFGVRHKERLKQLRAEVDFLALTATPIPRTLNMAMGGLRELSLIATPPESRLSIKTFVTRWHDAVVREACQRELKRGGQVYFVHNRIEDIEGVAERVASLLPEARIELAHGQMPERELERIMLDFYHRRFHILVCTAIIESGLDVPSANTIVINRADRFGLAQLHQLRGRVGRSHHQAFAYLLTPPPESLTEDARKRLAAIESLEDLGAGFVLATHDLEIRGAGELLGEEQSGQIQEIGFSLYNEMLARTVQALRRGETPDPDAALPQLTDFNLHLPALIPADYMPDVHLRLVQYKRIASASDTAALRELQVEFIDRFGLLPEPTRHLFRLTALRLRAAPLGLKRLELGPAGGRVEFAAGTAVDPATLVQLIESQPERYQLDRQQRLRIRANLADAESRFRFAGELLAALGAPADGTDGDRPE
ncbi:MAG: transcription-repair coupling factor [Gammaproteobacteria bacterium]|nr:MAG: transcription-repair coupling factor [Gammaproteobacteria bacterium]